MVSMVLGCEIMMHVRHLAYVMGLSCLALAAGPLQRWAGERSAFAQASELDTLRDAARASPRDPAAALALGRALRRAGQYVPALTELRRGVALAFASPGVLAQLRWEIARVHMDRHDFGQAMTACRVLQKLPGGAAEGHACAADAHLVWQRATEALSETAEALAKDPRCYEARVAEGRAEELALDPAKAEASYRAALALRPDGVDAHLNLGRLLARNGRKDEGVSELRRAVLLDPNGPDALFELASALGPGPESVGLLEHATRERPSFAEAWLSLGRLKLAAGRLDEAEHCAEQAVREDPGDAAPHVLLGQVALAQGRADDAIRAGEDALKLVANSAPAKLLVADGHANKGEIDLALEAYQAAWGLDHSDPTPLVHAAQACHSAGRDTSARAFGLRATQEFPRWAPAWAAYGDALAAQGEKQAARDAYQKALAADGPVDRSAVQARLSALR
jgi:tetratricopeptide (TPR) repeat protein